jgi:CubicO group peptidase (beta-lactamase class C family)
MDVEPAGSSRLLTAESTDDRVVWQRISKIVGRHPAVGLAVGVIANGGVSFYGHGLADIASQTPITEDTVFRIGSVTKIFTAIAVMQLWEQGLIDLDVPVNDYLRAYRLIPARPTHRPATMRHLMTHTSGLPQCVHLSRAFKPTLGEMVPFGRPVPTLAQYYRGALRLVAEPGKRHIYSNHGFATLGQVIEDVTGESLPSYFRAHISEPLGLEQTDLVRSDRVRQRLATGYAFRPNGPRPVGDRDLITIAGGGIYSTTRDVARLAAALLGGGFNEHGSVLEPGSVGAMFAPQYQPDPRLAGVGLAFYRRVVDGHLFIEKSGLVPGFASQLCIAPDDRVGVVAFTNGAKGAHGWLSAEASNVLRHVLGEADEAIRADVPHHPETWNELCGWYSLRGSWRDVQKWLLVGAEITVRGGQLVLRPEAPMPGLRGFPLHPDDPADPYVFRVDLSKLGLGIVRVLFSPGVGTPAPAFHLEMEPLMSFDRRPALSNPKPWAIGTVVAGTASAVAWRISKRGQASP